MKVKASKLIEAISAYCMAEGQDLDISISMGTCKENIINSDDLNLIFDSGRLILADYLLDDNKKVCSICRNETLGPLSTCPECGRMVCVNCCSTKDNICGLCR